MTRVRLSLWALAATAATALFNGYTVDAAAFEIDLPSPKIFLSNGVPKLELTVTPPQPALKELIIETIVNTAGQTIVSDLKASGNGAKFTATVDTKLDAGLYKMKVSSAPEEGQEAVYEVLPFKVAIPVEVASANLNGLKLKVGDQIKNQLFSSGSGDALKVEVQLRNAVDKSQVVAHQAFLRFTHVQEKINTYFVLTPDSAKVHSSVLNFGALSKKFSHKSGNHKVELIIGDPAFEKALVWDLGTVELLLGAAPPQAPSPLYAKPLLHESDTTLKALPEIKHIMRPQDPRPPIVVSLAFAAGVLAPLAGFLLYVLKLKLNISKLFAGSVFVFGVGFLGSLGAIFGLFALYWIELTMFQTLGYLAVLGSANIAFGHLTLKRLAQASLSDAHKAKKE
ncbi:hypothetical protein Poli38472_006759 [Pythium oligandrum]|uniref:Ribophorin II n=1 Tax=Pythium oligandrum TaxID=41045 RepID=A0A8K1C5C4_PYTOL|nr:hypothetical protein Poli38472_006759 [Pythium oligandrum]|eukprot:TMW56749.1 hypothetical protein Poli38472_006759 [Pythium oligandrum]